MSVPELRNLVSDRCSA